MPFYHDITVAGLDVRLFLFPAEWRRGLRISARMDGTVKSGKYSLEARSPNAESMVLSTSGDISIKGAAAYAWKKAMGGLGTRVAAWPIYPDILEAGEWDRRIFDAQWVADFSWGGAASVMRASDVGSETINSLRAPLIFGRFTKIPVGRLLTDDFVEGAFTFTENQGWDFRVDPRPQAPIEWPAAPDFSDPPEEQVVLDTNYQSLAPRGEILTHPEAIRRWRQSADFAFSDRAAIRQALGFFKAKGGTWRAFEMPTWLSVPTPNIEAPAAIRCRFASDSIDLDFDTDSSATANVGFLQEVSLTGFVQDPPPRKFLLRIQYQVDPVFEECYTNWDKPLVGPSGITFAPAQLKIGRRRRSMRPQDETFEFDLAFQAGSLLHDLYRDRLFAPLFVTLWQCDPAAAGSAAVIWEGRITSVKPNGEKWTAVAGVLGDLLNEKIPQFLFKRTCNWCVFSAECGVPESSHLSTGTITAAELVAPTTLQIALSGWGSPYPANWFKGGSIRTGSGRNFQTIGIVQSDAISGGKVKLYLSRPIVEEYITSGQPVTVVPGCDQTAATCKSKFGNYNGEKGGFGFSGAPFIPDYISTVTSSSPAPSK